MKSNLKWDRIKSRNPMYKIPNSLNHLRKLDDTKFLDDSDYNNVLIKK